MEAKTGVKTELPAQAAEEAKPSAVLSLRQIQEDVALQKKYAKTQLRLAAARTWMTALMLITLTALFFVGVPRVQSALARLDAALNEIESIDLNALGQSMEVLKLQGQGVADAATEKLDAALVEFNAMLATLKNVDIEALNESIADFSAIMEPLKEFLGG